MKGSFLVVSFFVVCLFPSCDSPSEVMQKPIEKKAQDPEKFVLTGELIRKGLIKKNGMETGYTDLYIRASVQDYYIKFCESEVDRGVLEPLVGQVISIHVVIKSGLWDDCNESETEVQSRTGNYVVVKELMN